MKSGVKCPERLAIYIERAFSKCISDSEREFMREQLEQIAEASAKLHSSAGQVLRHSAGDMAAQLNII